MNDLVFPSERGNPVTSSLLVAEKFGKEHKHVLDSIREILRSAENSAQFYYSTTYKDSMNRSQEMFIMSRDGFSLLVMGFTGKEAMKFKIEFIQAFNNMEALMKSDDFILSKAMNIMNRRIEALQEATKLQAKALAAAAPKVDYYDEVLRPDNTHTTTTIAKELGMSGKALHKKLRENGIMYHQDGHWVLYAKYQGSGYTKTRTHTYEVIEAGKNVKKTSISTVWTEKGRAFLHSIFKPVVATV